MLHGPHAFSARNWRGVLHDYFRDVCVSFFLRTPQPDSERCFALQTEPITPFTNWGPPQHAPFPVLAQNHRLMTEQTVKNPKHEKMTVAQKMYCCNHTAYISACYCRASGNRTVSLWYMLLLLFLFLFLVLFVFLFLALFLLLFLLHACEQLA